MLLRINTAGISGIDSYLIEVEADLSEGLSNFEIVGLGDTAVKESKERIKSAIKHSNCDLYKKRIIVNLAPASIKKEGSHYDLAIALSIMGTKEEFIKEKLDNSLFIGELSLNGELRGVNGVLPMAISAYEKGIRNIFLPVENAKEAAIVSGLNVYPVGHLMDVVYHLSGKKELETYKTEEEIYKNTDYEIDFSDVKGQENVKRAILVAAAASHNFLMVGNPGCGKTLIAERLPTILPKLTFEESLEVSKIYSVAGLIKKDEPLITKRPFRQVHHTVSTVGITGGGRIPKPGEISLAHRGVLFLDELPEFKRDTLETLRQPIEDGNITITRATGTLNYPCNVMMVVSLNPCPCGYQGSDVKECICTPNQIKNYMKKISGPLLDRIDIQIRVPNVKFSELSDKKSDITSEVMRKKVEAARQIQKERYKDYGFLTNKEIPAGLMDEFCPLGETEKNLLERAYNTLGLSARAHSRILKVARTIADLSESKDIKSNHIAEAIQYRSMDKFSN